MKLGRLLAAAVPSGPAYNFARGLRAADVAGADWRKSSLSAYNGSCVQVARLLAGEVGVRDTKDHAAGPVLVFNQAEWNAFLRAAKSGEFDSI